MSSIPRSYGQVPAMGSTSANKPNAPLPTTYLGRRVAFRTSVFQNQESVIVPIYRQAAGEFPPVWFPELRNYYTQDPDAWQAVNYIKNKAWFNGYNVTCDADVPGSEEASDFLQDWLDAVRWGDDENEAGFDILGPIISEEMSWAGTSIVEMIGNYPPPEPVDKITALAQVQISSIWRYQRDDSGQLRAIWQFPQINPRALDPSRYIHYLWNRVDRNPYGYGILHAMAQWKVGLNGASIPPLMLQKWQIEDDIRRRVHRYGSPRSIYNFPGLSQNEVKPMAEVLQDPEADASFATNLKDASITMDSPQGRMNFGPDLQYFQNRFMIGFGNPLSKLMGETGFSYASSKEAPVLADMVVWDHQQTFKKTTERKILNVILDQNVYDYRLLKPKFDFNIPEEPEQFLVADVLTAAQQGIITQEEARAILKEWLNWNITPEIPQLPGVNVNPPMVQPPPSPVAQNMITNSLERNRHNGHPRNRHK